MITWKLFYFVGLWSNRTFGLLMKNLNLGDLATISQVPFFIYRIDTSVASRKEFTKPWHFSKRLKQVDFNRVFRYLKRPDDGRLIGQRGSDCHLQLSCLFCSVFWDLIIKKMYGTERIKTMMISVFKAMTPDLISQIAKSQNGIEIIMPQKMPRRIIEKYPLESEWRGWLTQQI